MHYQGINQEGYKELPCMYIGEQEGARFWLSVLTDLQSRGVEDILIACIDNLQGFAEATESIYLRTEYEVCQRFHFFSDGQGIKLDEAYRFLLHRLHEKRVQLLQRTAKEPLQAKARKSGKA